MNVAAYVRVSSKAQDVGMQQLAITRAAEARGDHVVRWFSEKRSAKTIARPELDLVRSLARRGEIRKLYVYRLDRLARTGIRDTLEVVNELRVHGCELVSIADGFDLNGPATEIVLAVLSWASQMERLAINERIAAARDRVEAEGRHWGRPRRMDEVAVAKAKAMKAAGRTIREIAVAMKVPRPTVARALQPPVS